MLKFSNRRRISDLDRIRVYNKILFSTFLVFVIAFAFWLQVEFGILEVLWNKIF